MTAGCTFLSLQNITHILSNPSRICRNDYKVPKNG